MTLDEARDRIGHKVIYRTLAPSPSHAGAVVDVLVHDLDEGIITSVNDTYVFVRYGADVHSKATRPEDLESLP